MKRKLEVNPITFLKRNKKYVKLLPITIYIFTYSKKTLTSL